MTMVGNGDCIHIQSLTRGSGNRERNVYRVDKNVIMEEKGQFVGISEVLYIPYCPSDSAAFHVLVIMKAFTDIDNPKTM